MRKQGWLSCLPVTLRWMLGGIVGWSLVWGTGCQKKTPPPSGPATVVYLVRHAEKELDGKRNPSLTAVGRKRALALQRMLHSVALHAVYSTPYKRTRQTAEPAANAKRLPVTILKANQTKQLVAAIHSRHRGQNILISGHSNTVPEIIKALGVSQPIHLQEKTDYDNLFVVLLQGNNKPALLRFHFGPPPPKP